MRLRPRWTHRALTGEEGVASLLSLGLVLVLTVVAAALAAAGTVVAARHRAEGLADVAALAAAAHELSGETVACDAARRLVEEQHGQLISCRLDGADAVVAVGVAPPGRLASLGLLHGTARAGRRTP